MHAPNGRVQAVNGRPIHSCFSTTFCTASMMALCSIIISDHVVATLGQTEERLKDGQGWKILMRVAIGETNMSVFAFGAHRAYSKKRHRAFWGAKGLHQQKGEGRPAHTLCL